MPKTARNAARKRQKEPRKGAKRETTNDKFVVAKQSEVAQFFSVTTHTIQNWYRDGAPGAPGAYDLHEIAAWRLARRTPKPDDAVRDELLEAQTRERKAKAALAELQLAFERGEYLARDEIEEWDRARSAVVKRGLLGLGRSVAPSLVGLNVKEIQAVINRRARGLLTQFASFTREEKARTAKE